MSPDHLRRAREAIERQKRQREALQGPAPLPPTTRSFAGTANGKVDQKSNELIRINSGEGSKFTEADFLRANEQLAQDYNLIYCDGDIERVIEWLSGLGDVACDIETYGEARTKNVRKKLA